MGRGEQAGEEEEKGLLDLLIEARMLLQVNKKLPIISSVEKNTLFFLLEQHLFRKHQIV